MNIPRLPPNAAVMLPEEVIIEILSFLEVKYLMRMKCVCKSWNTFVSDPIFAKMHLKKKNLSTRKIQHLTLLSRNLHGSRYCRAIPISHLLDCTTNSITLTNNHDPYYRFNEEVVGQIVGSCNGLICLQAISFTADYHDHSLSFWNPATRTTSDTFVSFCSYAKRPQCEVCKFTFGYDNSTETYKVVLLSLKVEGSLKVDGSLQALWSTAAKVFTLGGDNNNNNAWRDIQCFPVVVVPHHFYFTKCDGLYLNNSINWLVFHRKNLTIEQSVIVSLDLGTETYTQFLLPPSCNEELLGHPCLSVPDRLFVLKDCMCFSYDFKKTHFIIWKMDEFGVEQSWTQFLKISYINLQIDYLPQLIPLCLSQNGDTIIFSVNQVDQAILYNWRDSTIRRIKSTNGIYWRNAKAYVESLISTDFRKTTIS